jgi:hypothetical protein
VTAAQIFVDPPPPFVDRSACGTAFMSTDGNEKLVRRECRYHFVGAHRREVVCTVTASNMEEARALFAASSESGTPILLIVKTETEIYLAQ